MAVSIKRKLAVGLIWIFPWTLAVLVAIGHPEVAAKMWAHPVARIALLVVFLWETLGCWLLLYVENIIVRIMLVIFFVGPAASANLSIPDLVWYGHLDAKSSSGTVK
jgi:Flp pilus assembly protein TadB